MLGFGALSQFALGEGPSARGNAWLPPWSEPVRQTIAPALAIALISSGAFISFNTDTSEAISTDKWFVPLSEPVRVKPRLLEALHQVEPNNPFGLLQKETVSIDRWLLPFAEPVRRLRSAVGQAGHDCGRATVLGLRRGAAVRRDRAHRSLGLSVGRAGTDEARAHSWSPSVL